MSAVTILRCLAHHHTGVMNKKITTNVVLNGSTSSQITLNQKFSQTRLLFNDTHIFNQKKSLLPHRYVSPKKQRDNTHHESKSITQARNKSTAIIRPLQERTALTTKKLQKSLPRRSILPKKRRENTQYKSISTTQARNKSTTVIRPPEESKDITDIINPLIATLREMLRQTLLKPRTLPFPRWITPRHFSVTISELCGHASFILVAISYALDDFLMLRVIAVAGSSSMLLFTYFHPHGRVLWLPFKWNLLFIVINCYRIGKALFEEHKASLLSPEFLNLQKEYFPAVQLVDFSKLVELGEIVDVAVGEQLVDQGESSPYVYLILSGKIHCYRDDICTYHIEIGDFVSESGIHCGLGLTGLVESSVRVVGNQPSRVMRWDRTQLNRLLRNSPSLDASLQSVISLDIVRKLKKQRNMIARKQVQNAELWTEKRNDQNFSRYVSILKNILSHRGQLNQKRKNIETYRLIHDIDDDHHLRALKKCDWTLEEYKLGYRKVGMPGPNIAAEQDDKIVTNLAHLK